MKKALSFVLLLALILTALTFPTYAETGSADTTTSASTEPAPAAPAPAAPATPAPAAPAPVKAPAANPAPAVTGVVEGNVYTVVSGDCFWKIAKRFNMTMDELAQLNPQVQNISRIFVGDKLIIKAAPVAAAVPAAPAVAATKLYHGFGEEANYRLGHTSLNITTASVIFDQDGKIKNVKFDVEEINPEIFPTWADEKTLSAADQAAFKAKIDDQWKTKWEKKDEYGMTESAISGKEWYEQMGFYQTFFQGKTVEEVKAWVAKYCDPKTNRPWKLAYLNSDKLKDADKDAIKAATANFTAEEKQMLVDVTTNATMSLQDDHSHFLNALEEAYADKVEIK